MGRLANGTSAPPETASNASSSTSADSTGSSVYSAFCAGLSSSGIIVCPLWSVLGSQGVKAAVVLVRDAQRPAGHLLEFGVGDVGDLRPRAGLGDVAPVVGGV